LEKDGRQFRTSNIGNNWVGGKGSEYAWYTWWRKIVWNGYPSQCKWWYHAS
jgi:hypothetical protein